MREEGEPTGSGEGRAGLPVGEGEVPVAVAVLEGHLAVGAGVLHDVAAAAHGVEPASVGGGHAGAAVRHVGVALGPDGPRGGVDELAGERHPHRPLHVVDVVGLGAVAVDADRLGVHPLHVELLDDHLGAGARGEAGLAGGDRKGAQQVAVGEDLHLVGAGIDLVDVGVADLEVDAARLLAVDAVARRQAVEVEVDRDVGPRLPVRRRAVVRLLVAHPVPGPALRGRARHLHVLLEERPVGDRDVEGHDDRHADAHGLAVQRRDRGEGLLGEREVDRVEAAGALHGAAVAAGGRGVDDVVGAGLEPVGRGPGAGGDLARDGAGRRRHLDRVERAALGTDRQRAVDRDGGSVGEARREAHRVGLGRLRSCRRARTVGATGAARAVGRGAARRESSGEHQQRGCQRRTTVRGAQVNGRASAHAT